MDALWCVHVLGPDSIIAQPDYPTAVRRAQQWIAVFADIASRTPPEKAIYAPICHCNVIPWNGTPAEHAAELAEHGGEPEDIC